MNKDKFWLNIIYILSAALSIAVAFLILGPRPEGVEGSIDISYLPFTNATLNSITTILLLVGYFFIRQKKREKHRIAMLSAFFSSALFLISYIIYHWFKSGPKLYNGEWIDSTPDGQYSPGEERLFDSYPLFYDVTTVMGRSFLANHLAILAVHTSSQNGKNKLSCNTDRCN